jgi:hypothetical protein
MTKAHKQTALTDLHYRFLEQLQNISRSHREFKGFTDSLILNDLLYAGFIDIDTHGVTVTQVGREAYERWYNA